MAAKKEAVDAVEQPPKAILKMGYVQFVLSPETAAKVFTLIMNDRAEVLTGEWKSDTSTTEHKVQPIKADELTLSPMPREQYALAKLLSKADQTKE